MPIALADRVKDTTTTTGTGTVTLSGTAPAGFQNFSAVGDGNSTYYTITAASEWEVGIGTYTASGTALSRDTVLSSSNAGSLVSFAAGSKDVFVTLPASKTPTTAYTRTSFTATASQTTFTVAYTVGLVSVYMNGVLLNASDYTASNGTSVVLSAAAALNDIVEVIAYSTVGAGSGMVYPGAGIANSTGSAWGTSYTTTGSGTVVALSAGPTFTGTLTMATPFTVGATSVTSTGAQLNYLNAATGTTGTTSTNVVFSTSPTLITPILGTPTSGNLANCTGVSLTAGVSGTLPVGNGGTGVTASTGSGNNVLSTSPTLTTPVIASIVNTGTLTLPTSTDTLVGRATTDTLTNKRVTERANFTTTTGSPWAINSDSYDTQGFTALANALTISADAGTPTQGQKMVIRIEDNATPRVLTFTGGASKAFRPVGVTMTVSGSNFTYTTTASKETYFGCIYNTDAARWDIVAIAQEA